MSQSTLCNKHLIFRAQRHTSPTPVHPEFNWKLRVISKFFDEPKLRRDHEPGGKAEAIEIQEHLCWKSTISLAAEINLAYEVRDRVNKDSEIQCSFV